MLSGLKQLPSFLQGCTAHMHVLHTNGVAYAVACQTPSCRHLGSSWLLYALLSVHVQRPAKQLWTRALAQKQLTGTHLARSIFSVLIAIMLRALPLSRPWYSSTPVVSSSSDMSRMLSW